VELLVLGGSSFLGRAVAEDGLRRGWRVATFNRGRRPPVSPDVEALSGDRLDPRDLGVLRGRRWDVVVDTWSGAPRAVRDSAAALREGAGRYVYVSSGSVYAPPPRIGGDESAPVVEASPEAGDDVDYPERKRGAELAVLGELGDRALLVRAGLILGPHEDVGRLPWWLLRLARGGEVLAPGPADLPLQLIDARDLAAWMLDAAVAGHGGPFNAVSRPGHTTMGGLLDACRAVTGADAHLTWVDAAAVERAGIEAWTELPIWLPPTHQYRGMLEADVERAHGAGLRARPVAETVRDTWDWLESAGRRPRLRADLPPVGLDPVKERRVLAAWHAARA
jgi:2'-hydroxyisoflavone reductase